MIMESGPIELMLKPTIDAFMKEHARHVFTPTLQTELAQILDKLLLKLGFNDRLIRVLEPEKDGSMVILVIIKDPDNTKDVEFSVTAITLRDVVPEGIK